MLELASLLAPLVLAAAAQGEEPATQEGVDLLIRDVRILNRQSGDAEVAASVLIRGGKLDIVTLDKVATSAVDVALDAQGGYLLGRLKIGDRPSFIVLSEDPREDFSVLLDTDTYTTLAVEDGVIVRNRLAPAMPRPEEEKPAGWLAYTPPPIALPLSYDAGESWNVYDTEWFSGAFVAALVIDRMVWTGQDDSSAAQVGDLDDFEGGEIRGFRFGTVGRINFERPWNYTVFAATNAFDKGFDTDRDDDLTLFDLRLDVPVFEGGVLSVGKQKEPISMERITGGAYLPMQERSVAADGLLPARNVGAVLSAPTLGGEMSWAVGVFNDWLDDEGSISDNATQVIGRVTGVAAHTADDSNLLHLGFGVRHSDAEEGGRFLAEPEFNNAPVFIDTGALTADSQTTFDAEIAWRRGPLWVSAEALWAEVDSSALGDPTLRGHYLQAAYNLTGEMRTYDRRNGTFGAVPVAKPADSGGSGTWEVAARWSALDATDAAVAGGEIDIFSLGVNWWISRTFQLSLNYRWIELDRDGLDGSSNGLNARILLIL